MNKRNNFYHGSEIWGKVIQKRKERNKSINDDITLEASKQSKKRKSKLKKCTAQKKANRDLYEHYKELFETSFKELKFANMQVQYLNSVLEEIESFTDDEMVKAVIENSRNRHMLDKIIHAKKIFE